MNYFYYFDKMFNNESVSRRTYKHITKDDKEILAVNVAGFSEDDIKIDVRTFGNESYLYIIAKPKKEVEQFVDDLTIRFAIQPDLIDEIIRETKDGMLYITVKRKENKPQIKIKFKE